MTLFSQSQLLLIAFDRLVEGLLIVVVVMVLD